MEKNNKKSILFVVDIIAINGVTAFIKNYAIYLKRKGLNVILIGEKGPALGDSELFDIFSIVPITVKFKSPQEKFIKRIIYRLVYMFTFARVSRKIIRENNVQAIHFNLPLSAFSILLFCPEVYAIPRILTFYGDRAWEILSTLKTSRFSVLVFIKFYAFRLIQWVTFKLSTTIIAPSKYLRKHLVKHYNGVSNKIKVIYGSIYINPQVNSKLLPRTDIYPFGYIHFFNNSRLDTRKGHLLLLQALKKLIDRNQKVTLTISSPLTIDDPLSVLQEYERLKLFNHVRFLHASNPRQRDWLMKNADAYITPSIALEGLGMVNLESLACGTPVIATPNGGMPEILSLIDPKLISKDYSPECLASVMMYFIKLDKPKRQMLRKRCLEVVRSHFNVEDNYQVLDKLYRI